MKLKVIQSQVGSFNLGSNEQSYVFKLGIVDDNGNVITKDGEKALLVYRGEPNEKHDFEDSMEELDWVYEQCWKYDKAQCIAFWEIYMDNHDELDQNYATAKKQKIEQQIERLQAELKKIKGLPDLDWTGNFIFQKERSTHELFAAKCEEVINQLVKDSEMYDEEKKRLENYYKLINKYDLLVKKSGC